MNLFDRVFYRVNRVDRISVGLISDLLVLRSAKSIYSHLRTRGYSSVNFYDCVHIVSLIDYESMRRFPPVKGEIGLI